MPLSLGLSMMPLMRNKAPFPRTLIGPQGRAQRCLWLRRSPVLRPPLYSSAGPFFFAWDLKGFDIRVRRGYSPACRSAMCSNKRHVQLAAWLLEKQGYLLSYLNETFRVVRMHASAN